MSELAQVTFFRLSMRVPRLIAPLPLGGQKPQTVGDVFVLGDLPAVSALHAANLYWQNCPRKKPALLDEAGKPIRVALLKRKDLRARLRLPEDKPIPGNISAQRREDNL